MDENHGDFKRLIDLIFGEGERMSWLIKESHRYYQK